MSVRANNSYSVIVFLRRLIRMDEPALPAATGSSGKSLFGWRRIGDCLFGLLDQIVDQFFPGLSEIRITREPVEFRERLRKLRVTEATSYQGHAGQRVRIGAGKFRIQFRPIHVDAMKLLIGFLRFRLFASGQSH